MKVLIIIRAEYIVENGNGRDRYKFRTNTPREATIIPANKLTGEVVKNEKSIILSDEYVLVESLKSSFAIPEEY